MKKLAFILCILLIMFACNTQKQLPQDNDTASENNITENDTVRIANDELEYEVIIIDAGFNYWLTSRARPRGYYTQNYLETKNLLWITEWNSRVLQPQRYNDLYQMRIDYSQSIDYGYEVNYLIYNYLVYFQLTNNQRLGGIVPQN